MAGIASRLLTQCVLIDPPVRSKEDAIRRLVDCLAAGHAIRDPAKVYADVLERERLASTCIGAGCAVPHAHSQALDRTVLAAARLNPPGRFGAPDGEPVSLMFLLAGPAGNARLHIRLLSTLARLLHDAPFREALRKAGSAEEFHRLVCEKDG